MLVSIDRRSHPAGMGKRLVATFLWFYAGWYAGAMVAWLLGVSPLLGPIIGTAAAALFAGDPRGLIWPKRSPVIDRRIQAIANS